MSLVTFHDTYLSLSIIDTEILFKERGETGGDKSWCGSVVSVVRLGVSEREPVGVPLLQGKT